MSETNWQDVRAQMLAEPDIAYLNTGSYGLVPRLVFEAVTEFRRRLAAQPCDFLWRQLPELLWTARRRLAEYLGGGPERLVFTVNVTAAINTVARGLRLPAGSEILLSNHEYPAMRHCWEHIAGRRGWQVRELALPTLPRDTAEVVRTIEESLSDQTRVLFLSHVLYTTGMVLPVREICAMARERGILTVIDGAHAPGMVLLNLADLPCDYYCGNCHKWLLAPTGAGFLYMGEGHENDLDPLVVSWGYKNSATDRLARDDQGSTAAVRFHEFQGTRDPASWLAVPATLDFRAGVGEAAIAARIGELADYARKRLGQRPGWKVQTPQGAPLRGGLTAFSVPAEAPQRLSTLLWEHFRIEVPVVDHTAGRFLRVSTHFYNAPEEIDRLAEALAQLVDAGAKR